jgi:hypothetical protein
MMTRQQFIHAGAALIAAPLGLVACAPVSYEDAVKKTWHRMPGPYQGELALKQELVRYATLAPSGHNTQCWKFRVSANAITILPDFTRRTPVVDPDDHHLFVSLGCALENMSQAALAFGLKAQPKFDATTHALSVGLEPTKTVVSPLYQAIPERQCTRGPYDGKPLNLSELKTLEIAGTGDGVRVMLFTAKAEIEKILAFVIQGNSVQMNDAAFVKELKQWLRFGASQAVETGDGLYSLTSGNPSVPRWLGSPMFDIMFKANSENDKYAEQTRSSAGIAVFISDIDDKAHWIEAGRCYERFALQATSMGIRNAMLNQTVEVPALRQQLTNFLGLQGGRPDLVVRFGRGAKMPQSLRRDVSTVLV